MKLLPLLALLCPALAWGQDLSGSYIFQSPQGPVTLELRHNGRQVTGTMTGADGSVNRLDGTFDGQKATGTIAVASGTGWFAAGLREGGLTLVVAEIDPVTGEPDLEGGWELNFSRGGASAQAPRPPAGSPLVQQWMQHLRGKKVTYVDSYSSSDIGGSGGYSSRWEAYLCGDGSFHYRGSSSVSADVGGVYGGGSGGDSFSGTWRIIDQGGQAILQYQRGELAGTGEGQWVALSYRNGETRFDGSRVYVTADNGLCP